VRTPDDDTVATSHAAESAVSPDADTVAATPSPTRAVAEVAEGSQIGRYTVLRRLGAGGMGVVYAARDGELARDIALKVLRDERGGNVALETRLQREAQAMARLAHANVVRVFDVGSHQGHVFLAMELIDGAPVADWLAERPHRWREVVDVYREAGRGLAEAHAAGIVHRDFKPGNVMIDRKGRVVVGDFGLARAAGLPLADGSGSDSDDERLTRDGALVGTPRYAAPEQLAREDATVLSDQFSFAVSLFEGVAGIPPFRGATVNALLAEIRAGRVAPARMPGWLRRVLVRALAADPAKRYPSMGALLDALDTGRKRPARIAIGAGLVGLAAAGAAVAIAVGAAQHEPACAHATDRTEAAWTNAQRTRIMEQLPKLRPAFGAATADRVIRRLDDYAQALAKHQLGACKVSVGEEAATRTYDPQCLDAGTRSLAKVASAFAGASAPEVVDHADELLGQLADCDNPRAASAVKLPEPAQKPSVDKLRDQLADVDLIAARGDYAGALAAVTPLVDQARAAGYPPVLGETLAHAGHIELQLQDKRAEAHLREAAEVAAAAHDDHTAAHAWTDLLVAAGNEPDKPDRFDTTLAAATTEVAHTGDAADRAQLDLVTGTAHLHAGKYMDAEADCKRALDTLGKLHQPDSLAVRPALHCIGEAIESRGDYTTGRTWYERALAIDRKVLGEDHPQTAEDVQGLADLELRMGHFKEGKELAAKALAVRARVFGAESDVVAKSEKTLADLLLDSGDAEGALPHAQHALDIATKHHGADSLYAAAPLATIGTIMHDLHRKPEAEPYLARAVAIYEHGDNQAGLGITLINQADNFIDEQKWDEALAASRHAITALQAGMGSDSQIVGFGYYDTARSLDALGKPGEAVSLMEQAVKMVDPSTSDPDTVALFEYELARSLWASGGDKARSIELAKDAHAKLVQIGDTAGSSATRADIEKFLATHHAR
jgi:tetratricopeptide (TPR) repeat protein